MDLKILRKRGYDYVCCCEFIEYFYMRCFFLMENFFFFEMEIYYLEDYDDDDGKFSEKRIKEFMEFVENENSDMVFFFKDNWYLWDFFLRWL